MNWDTHYLVLTNRVTAALRRAYGRDRDLSIAHRVISGALKGAKPLRSFETERGHMKLFDVYLNGIDGRCRVGIMWGQDRDGTPRLAPDGVKRVVFAVSLGIYHDRD